MNLNVFYTVPSQTESTQTFVIRALEDTALEGDESFTVRLLPGTSAAVIDPLAGQWVRGAWSSGVGPMRTSVEGSL